MRLNFKDGVLWIDKDGVRCNSDYVDSEAVRSLVCQIWRKRAISEARSFFLPYSIDDEYVHAFECTRGADDLCLLRCVELDGIGYDHGEDDLVMFASSVGVVLSRRKKDFCALKRDVLLASIDEFCSE